jgi:RNA polymerase sigma-70 factor (ECF subfamily)
MAAVASGARTEQLFLTHEKQIYSFCLWRLRDRQEAEDAVQSTFLNAFRALERGVVPYAEAAWLYKIADNVCRTRTRAAYRRGRVETPSVIDDSVASPEIDEETIDLRGALRRLPLRQRRAIVLREWQGLGYGEIGAELGLTRAAVETLLHRARRSLRAAA